MAFGAEQNGRRNRGAYFVATSTGRKVAFSGKLPKQYSVGTDGLHYLEDLYVAASKSSEAPLTG